MTSRLIDYRTVQRRNFRAGVITGAVVGLLGSPLAVGKLMRRVSPVGK